MGIMTYVFSGTVSGYVSARIFKFTGASFPGLLMVLFLCLNIFLSLYGSAKSVRIFTIFAAFFLWLGVASPLVFVGSFIGFKRDPISVPTRTNQIARVVPSGNSF